MGNTEDSFNIVSYNMQSLLLVVLLYLQILLPSIQSISYAFNINDNGHNHAWNSLNTKPEL